MPSLQHLLSNHFVTSTHGQNHADEIVFEHPLTQTRLAMAAGPATVQALAAFNWTVATATNAPAFNVLAALQRQFPTLPSVHPDALASVLDAVSTHQLLTAQALEHRGRLARWLIGRSQSTGSADLALWTRQACLDLDLVAEHPLANALQQAIYLEAPSGVARITGNELDGYVLLQVEAGTGRAMVSTAATIGDFWVPNAEWTPAQWQAYEQLLTSTPAQAAAFDAHVTPEQAAAATHVQHIWAAQMGAKAYLGNSVAALRRNFRHAPTSSWLDQACAETGLSLKSTHDRDTLVDLYLVECLSDAQIEELIVPAMRSADSELAEMSVAALVATWRNAYNPLLTYAHGARPSPIAKIRASHSAGEEKSTAESMRAALGAYYGSSAVETLERRGKLKLLSHLTELPGHLLDEVRLNNSELASGITVDDVVYLIGENAAPSRVCGIFLHEVGEHAALHQMLGRDYGRVVKRFNQLLAEGDTYALQAAMKVPANTHPANLSSEHLAYLIQLTAEDMKPKLGGEGGYELGQRCISELRTWLFRTPLMRELEQQGEMTNFRLEPQDIATLAREAVDFYVAGDSSPTLDHNSWANKLSQDTIAALYAAGLDDRVAVLSGMTGEVQLAYLYSLASADAPGARDTLEHFLTEIAVAGVSSDPGVRALSGELNVLAMRMSNVGRATEQLGKEGIFASMSGTDDPSTSVLLILRQTAVGHWDAEHYTHGLGLTLTESFESIAAATQSIGHHHFPVSPSEIDSVIARWGKAIVAEHGHLDSKAFQRWYTGSQARHDDGSPMVMYHGTRADFSVSRGMFWASAATPSALRDQPNVYEMMGAQAKAIERANVSDLQGAVARFEVVAKPDATTTPAFKNWFEGSTIVDSDGEPLMVYHGTDADFSQFNGGPSFFTPRQDYSYIQNSGVVMPVYLSIRNPYRPANQSEIEQIRSNPDRLAELQALGYDGMLWAKDGNMLRGASGWGNDLPQIVAFSPNQVKSAIGNVGTFDPASPDIRFDLPPIARQTETSEFKKWYGDSQLLDATGQPLVFYHGTDQAITQFDASKVQSRFPFSFGFHFTSSTSEASIYADSITNSVEGFNPASHFSKPPLEGGNVMPVYLRAERPLIINTDMLAASMEADTNRAQIMAKLADARRAGQPFDSVIIKRERGDEYDGTNVIVFEPSQIKSAVGNVGTFERQTADIRFNQPVRPSAFSTWFAESKVVGADGKPLVVYHGTGADIRSFRIGAYFSAEPGQANDYAVAGAEIAADGAANVMPVYLSIQNPAIVDTDYIEWAGYKATEREALIAQGHDGMMNEQMTEIVPFYRGQVKSAVGNAGTYNRASGDIRFDAQARPPATNTPESTGSTDDFHLAPRPPAGLPSVSKGSTLADGYAGALSTIYGDTGQDRGRPSVMPVYLSAKTPFDADQLVGSAVRLSDLRDALVEQAEQAGRHVDVVKIGALFRTAFLAARSEESGPHYAKHDFWNDTDSMFGAAGSAALRQMFAECGFDSIKLTEREHLTYGVFEPSQVKSAIGNTGLYSASPDMRFTFAGSRATTAPRSMLAKAKYLDEQSVAPELIWKETGWTLGFDSQWRFELDDSAARIRGFDYTTYEPEITTTRPERYLDWADEAENAPDGVPLPLVLDHPALFAAYPQMANVRVKTFPSTPDDGAVAYFAFWPGNFGLSQIFVRDQYSIGPDLFRSALIHETQHGVQHLEGFAPGATPDAFKGSGTAAPELLAKMRTYVDIAENATELACPPQHFAEVSGQSADIVERVTSWVHQGNWEANIASFRRDLMSPYQLYLHEAGEVEARNTQQRLFLNAEQRAELFPGDTLDVDGALVRVTTRLFAPSASMMAPMGRRPNKADSSLEWALKTHAWRAGRCDDAELIQAGESVNLYKMGSTVGPDSELAEIFAVDLQGTVVGAFLYGPAADGMTQVAAMVAPLNRRLGIATAACDAITRISGRGTKSADTSATGPSQAFWASREGHVPVASQSDSAALAKWFGKSHTMDANGKPQVFFHGTHTAFKTFDASRHRSILNKRYQGDAFHFTKSSSVASQYASAARNQLFRQQDLFAAADQALPLPMAELLKGMVLEGDAIWDKFTGEQIRDLSDFARASGIDLNDLMDIADYVEGSASARPSNEINLFATHHDRDMPEHVKVDAIALGLGDAIPAPVVMPVFLKCENTLYTDDRNQARRAEQNGYDSVCYTGHDIVGGEPEWMVFSSNQIRSALEFDKAAIVHRNSIEQSQASQVNAPIAPPADRSFDRWIADTHCISLYGEPRLVFFHKPPTEQGHTFSDMDCALLDDSGKITPAYLAIRAPFVVTDQHTISASDLTEKLGDRKAALIIGEYLRDGALHLDDLFAHPRCAKWIEQAGFDGAIYRNLDGQNRYLIYQPNQALIGSGVSPDLSGPVIWGSVPQLPKLEFMGERVRSRQFTLANQSRPSGHIVPIAAADQYLASSGKLYVNMLGHERLTSVRIASLVEDLSNNKHMREFLFSNRKALAGKARIEDVFAEHIRNLRFSIKEAREDASRDTERSSHHRVTEDRLRNALGWAVEVAEEGRSFKGILGQDLLIWNHPINEQGELVRNALASLGIDGLYEVRSEGRPVMMTSNKYTAWDCAKEYPNATVVQRPSTTLTGRAIYEELASDLGNSRLASELLAGIGITGARQSDNEVLLFHPEVNHKPMPSFKWNTSNRLAMANAEGFKVQDLGGVQIGGGLHHSLHALACNRDRALQVTHAAINLLTARAVAHQQGGQDGPDSQIKTRLAAARENLQILNGNIPSSSFLHWREPLASWAIEKIAPIINIDLNHQLPGSAVFELLARRQGGIDRAQDMLSSVGIYGAHDELATLCWHPAAEKILNVVAGDVPPRDLGASTGMPKIERDREIIGMRA